MFADGSGILFQAGALLLIQVLRNRRPGTATAGGPAGGGCRGRSMTPGKMVADLAVALALGGDCLADVAILRPEPALFEPVASDPVISRLVGPPAQARAAGPGGAARPARGAARERAWALAGQAAPGTDGEQTRRSTLTPRS